VESQGQPETITTTIYASPYQLTEQPSGFGAAAPAALAALLAAPSEQGRDEAWAAFVRAYTTAILRVARSLGGDADSVMDRYAYVLVHLREDDCRRLRAYVRPGAGEFALWLTVVVRRLCLDHYRERYGRERGSKTGAPSDRAGRRRLVDLVAERTDPELLASPSRDRPDAELARAERLRGLGAAMDGLSPADRLLLRLRFGEEATAREIARLMRFPTVFHVYRRLDRLMKDLRRALDALGIEPES
jgi:RNA polymerase sigma factor (sigma-70 family)